MGYTYPATVAALFVNGINEGHFGAHGFGALPDGMLPDGLIRALKTERRPIYDKQGHDHSGDHTLVAQFRKT